MEETKENNDVYGPDTHLGPAILLPPESLFLILQSWFHSLRSGSHYLISYTYCKKCMPFASQNIFCLFYLSPDSFRLQ